MIRLETDRLILRNYIPEDVPAVHKYFSNEEVSRCEDFWPMSVEDVTEMLSDWKDMDNRMAVILKETSELIGSAGYRIDDEKEEPEYSIDHDFNPRFWHKGSATEAAKAVVEHLIAVLHAKEIFGDCDERNLASAGLMKRLGFQLIGTEDSSCKDDAEGNPIMV